MLDSLKKKKKKKNLFLADCIFSHLFATPCKNTPAETSALCCLAVSVKTRINGCVTLQMAAF